MKLLLLSLIIALSACTPAPEVTRVDLVRCVARDGDTIREIPCPVPDGTNTEHERTTTRT